MVPFIDFTLERGPSTFRLRVRVWFDRHAGKVIVAVCVTVILALLAYAGAITSDVGAAFAKLPALLK